MTEAERTERILVVDDDEQNRLLISGFEVVRRLRLDAERGEVPVIMVTMLDGRQDRLRAVPDLLDLFVAQREGALAVRASLRDDPWRVGSAAASGSQA